MTDGPVIDSGFQLLADGTRLAILRELSERLREAPESPTVGFSELRRRVGVDDSGNFNYHLDRLAGRFVRKTDDGYRITAAGLKVVAAAIAGVYGPERHLGPRSIDEDCPVCGEGLSATYEEGLLCVSCSNAHEFKNTLPPGSIDERDLDGIVELFTLVTYQRVELATEGICPLCSARLEWSVDPSFDPELPRFRTQCDRCGAIAEVPVAAALLPEPAVVAFFHDHGVDVRRRPPWAPELYEGVSVATRSDPFRIDVTLRLDGDTLSAALDGALTVREIDSPG